MRASQHHGPSIGRAFDAAALAHAERPALLGRSHAVDYASLRRGADQFARALRRRGVLPGDVVAVAAGRSASTLVAFLGILKAGAAYVPLDPAEPAARLQGLLADCAPALVLAARPRGMPGAPSVGPALDLEEALAAAGQEDDGPLDDSAGPGDAACIMYTSGSSGRPKGVVVPHRAILRLVNGQDYAPFGPGETMLHLAPLAFDASTFEIWGALLNGGRLAIVAAPQPSLDDIAEAIRRHGATTAWFTAGLFSLIVDHRLDALAPLRCILAGGDVLSPAHVARAHAGLPDCRIVNGYGPTENTTFTCCYAIPRGGWGGGPVPIGEPIRGTGVHILGPDLAEVAPGEVGQICCSGDGLALGYLNQPELTDAAFVHGPAGERLYLTGDLGRRRDDGAIEFCGRTDFQVKIDGKRIELGAIENALRADPAIHDAVVVARPAPAGTRQLVAYLKPRAPWAPQLAAARAAEALARLGAVLPGYMVPTAAMVLAEFPLTTNGKVDRAGLPPPPPPTPSPRPAPRRAGAARSGTEAAVAAVWQEVLGLGGVGRDTNFFDLGGTSLLLMAMHDRLQAALGLRVPLVTLFDCTTVRALAAALDGLRHPVAGRSPAFGGAAAPGTALTGGSAA